MAWGVKFGPAQQIAKFLFCTPCIRKNMGVFVLGTGL